MEVSLIKILMPWILRDVISAIPLNSNNGIEADFDRLKLVPSARKAHKIFLHRVIVMHFNSKNNYLSTRSKGFHGLKSALNLSIPRLLGNLCSSYNFHGISGTP